MIRSATGRDLQAFLHLVTSRPNRFAQVVLCSPFIDAEAATLLLEWTESAAWVGCGVRVVTSPAVARNLRRRMPPHRAHLRNQIMGARGLHAKVYVGFARRRAESCALVSSANLTTAGMAENFEFRVWVDMTTSEGRRLFGQVADFVSRMGTEFFLQEARIR